jgi:NADPH:quinone reductase and related Zn-dependent oxidoreductases
MIDETTDLSGVGWPAACPIPTTMTAVTFRQFGGPEVLRAEQIETPTPAPGEVLIKVGAVSVGRLLDLVARSGKHPYAKFAFPHILGAEHAGVIAGLGEGVDGFSIGDRVATFPVITCATCEFCLVGYTELCVSLQIIGTHRQGAYAEYIAVPSEVVNLVPEGMTPTEAVAVALAGAVALNQFDRAGLRPGDRVIVQGATSALGSTTALMARHLGAEVIVTSRHEDKRERLREFGFDVVLDATSESFPADVRQAFGGRGAKIIIDNLGESRVWANGMQALDVGGTVVSSGAFLGHDVTISLQRLYSSGQRVIGVRTGNLGSARRLWNEVRGGFRSPTDRTFSLADAADAHRYVESNSNFGRVSLVVP